MERLTLNEITEIANSYTDETFNSTEILKFLNSGISRINIAIKSKLPQFRPSDDSEAYLHLNADWMNTVVIPYICWSIKMNDGSLNEAQAYLIQYRMGLDELQKNKRTAIPEAYQGEGFTNTYQISRYNKMKAPGAGFSDVPIQDMPVKED